MQPHSTKNATYHSRVSMHDGREIYTTIANHVQAHGGSLFYLQLMEDETHRLVLVLPTSKTEIFNIEYPQTPNSQQPENNPHTL